MLIQRQQGRGLWVTNEWSQQFLGGEITADQSHQLPAGQRGSGVEKGGCVILRPGSFTVLLIHLPWVEMLHNNKISPEVCLEATPSWSWGEKAHFIIIYCQRIKFGWQRNLSLSFTCCMWTAPHVGIDLKGFIGIYSRHCSTSKLLTVLFCLTYTLERLFPGVPTFKHPPLTWIGAVVLSHEVMDL